MLGERHLQRLAGQLPAHVRAVARTAAQRREHPGALRQRGEPPAHRLPGVPGGQRAGHRPLAVVGVHHEPAGGRVHLVAAQRPELADRRRPAQRQRAPGDRAQVLGVLAADLGERPQVEPGRVGLRRRDRGQGQAAVPGHLRVQRDGGGLPPAGRGDVGQAACRDVVRPQVQLESGLGEPAPLHLVALGRPRRPPGPGGRGRRHLGQGLLPGTCHVRTLPLSPTTRRTDVRRGSPVDQTLATPGEAATRGARTRGDHPGARQLRGLDSGHGRWRVHGPLA